MNFTVATMEDLPIGCRRCCKELGSDTEMENVESQNFHKGVGFGVESHIVHFIKKE